MADTTSPPATAALNSTSPTGFLDTIWNSLTNTFTEVSHTAENYFTALANADVAATQAKIDAARQAQLNPPAASGTTGSNGTLILGMLGLALVFLIARK